MAEGMAFFVGIHQPHQANLVERAFVSVHRLEKRKSMFPMPEAGAIIDSGSFTTILKHGGYPEQPEIYAGHVSRFVHPRLLAAVTQDFMCEPHMLERTKARAVAERMARRGFIAEVTRRELIRIHQRWTIKRYDRLLRAMPAGVYLMPVLQGYDPQDYVDHIAMYGDRLTPGMWVGVGSVCKRNGDPAAVASVLMAIHDARPDLRLHGFGLKITALMDGLIRELLFSADSMAWSFAARKQGRDGNDINEAIAFERRVNTMRARAPMWQYSLGLAA